MFFFTIWSLLSLSIMVSDWANFHFSSKPDEEIKLLVHQNWLTFLSERDYEKLQISFYLVSILSCIQSVIIMWKSFHLLQKNIVLALTKPGGKKICSKWILSEDYYKGKTFAIKSMADSSDISHQFKTALTSLPPEERKLAWDWIFI